VSWEKCKQTNSSKKEEEKNIWADVATLLLF
jgi:hypothetical protein